MVFLVEGITIYIFSISSNLKPNGIYGDVLLRDPFYFLANLRTFCLCVPQFWGKLVVCFCFLRFLLLMFLITSFHLDLLIFSIADFSGMLQGKLQIQTAAASDLVASKKGFLVCNLSYGGHRHWLVYTMMSHSLGFLYT